jgi:hypothetical protein
MIAKTHPADRTLEQYLTRTVALLADIKRWVADFSLCIECGETSINEERHGHYQAPTLIMRDTQGKLIAEVIPFGEAILGAWGRVDVVGEYGKREKIVYLSAGGPTMTMQVQVGEAEESTRRLYRGVDAEGWYWVSPHPIRRAYPLTCEVFADLLSAVSGHEFQF